ncbi:MAG: hypothetical protein ACYC0V_15795 [Armatimonadota bacterium]
MESEREPLRVYGGYYTEAWLLMIFAGIFVLFPFLLILDIFGYMSFFSLAGHQPSVSEKWLAVAIFMPAAFILQRLLFVNAAQIAATTLAVFDDSIIIKEWYGSTKRYFLDNELGIEESPRSEWYRLVGMCERIISKGGSIITEEPKMCSSSLGMIKYKSEMADFRDVIDQLKQIGRSNE